MSNYNSLHRCLYSILVEELPDAKNSEVLRLANRLGMAAVEWMPKQGDLWLNEDDNVIYVNKGWEEVFIEKPE